MKNLAEALKEKSTFCCFYRESCHEGYTRVETLDKDPRLADSEP